QDVAVERALGRAGEAGQGKGPGFVEREAGAAAGRLALERPPEAYGAAPGVKDDGASIAGPATHRQGRTGRQEDVASRGVKGQGPARRQDGERIGRVAECPRIAGGLQGRARPDGDSRGGVQG